MRPPDQLDGSRRGVPHRLNLRIHSAIGLPHTRFLRTHLLAAHCIIQPALRDLSLAVVTDATMSQLHERYLRVRGPTDVLTFELEENEAGHIIAGEVVICVDEARRQALLRGSMLSKELLLYALHGLLHLSGFDDRTQPGYRKMHRKEDAILTRLGIGPVFAGKSHRRSPARSEVE